MKSNGTASVFVCIIAALGACADNSHERGAGVDNQGDRVLVGSVSTSDNTALPASGAVIVRLVETGSEQVIARQEIDIQKNQKLPIPYRLRYDAHEIKSTNRYYVEANVRSHGDTKWKSDRAPALTDGAQDNNIALSVFPNP